MVPEGRQLFPEHTVRENLELGAYPRLRAGKRAEFSENLVDIFSCSRVSRSGSNSQPDS